MSKCNIAARRRARRFALQALYQWQFNPSSIGMLLAEFLKQSEMVSVDTDFFQKLVKNIILHAHSLDEKIKPFLSLSPFPPQPVELAILRIGAYELTEELGTPYRVIVNEAIELAKAFGGVEAYRYINGILHQLASTSRPNEVVSKA